jgi:hypothetical protein
MKCKNCKNCEVFLSADEKTASCPDCGSFRIGDDNTWTPCDPVQAADPVQVQPDPAAVQTADPVQVDKMIEEQTRLDLESYPKKRGGILSNVLLFIGVGLLGYSGFIWLKSRKQNPVK